MARSRHIDPASLRSGGWLLSVLSVLIFSVACSPSESRLSGGDQDSASHDGDGHAHEGDHDHGLGDSDGGLSGDLAMSFDKLAVEVACGECQFGMDGTGCDLAVRLNDTAWFVDGSAIDDHGDAHAADGFCNTVRKGVISGEVKDGRFVASSLTVD